MWQSAESCLGAVEAAMARVAEAAPENEPKKTNHQNHPRGKKNSQQLLPIT